MKACGITDVGLQRHENQDSFAVERGVADGQLIAVVCDGMGGERYGQVASSLAVHAFLEALRTVLCTEMNAEQLREALSFCVSKANTAVYSHALAHEECHGMGTTLVAAVTDGSGVMVCNVGDSRAYRIGGGKIERVTRDHSLVADLVEQGRITEEEARVHPQRSVITRALGSDVTVEPDIYILRVSRGDRLLLCSDGLSSMIEDSTIANVLRSNDDPESCCDALIREALAAGGLDNVTCIVVDPLRDLDTRPKTTGAASWLKAHLAPIAFALIFVAICLGGVCGAYAYAQNSFYVIAQDGYVCVYRGLPGSFGGIKLSWLEESTNIPVSKLAPTTASRLESGMSVDSLDAAQALLADYRHTTGIEADDGSADPDAKSAADAEPDAQEPADTSKNQ